MAEIVLYMWMSLDGFIAGPEDGPDQGLGVDGERLHDPLALDDGDPNTVRSADAASAAVLADAMTTGARSPAAGPSTTPGSGTATTTTVSRSSC